jgi:hypothetical protein
MRPIIISCVAALLVAATTVLPAFAAAPEALDPVSQSSDVSAPALGTPLVEHQLDTEMTVHNWVLCASQPSAQSLVGARQNGADAAAKAFADLKASKACGQFTEMQVILQKPLYETLVDSGAQAGIYGALVNISGSWASAYVVYGGMPNQ